MFSMNLLLLVVRYRHHKKEAYPLFSCQNISWKYPWHRVLLTNLLYSKEFIKQQFSYPNVTLIKFFVFAIKFQTPPVLHFFCNEDNLRSPFSDSIAFAACVHLEALIQMLFPVSWSPHVGVVLLVLLRSVPTYGPGIYLGFLTIPVLLWNITKS